jgi:DNA-binding transcriptional LysR family regulator
VSWCLLLCWLVDNHNNRIGPARHADWLSRLRPVAHQHSCWPAGCSCAGQRGAIGRVELRELRSFIAVAEQGGLTAAARELHLSQSALSQTMQSLERHLGVQLLIRTSTGTRLTGAGEVLLREARVLLAHHDRVLATVAATESGISGVLRVGVPLELPADLLLGPVTQLRHALPDVRVQPRHLSTAEQLAELRADRLDIALVRQKAVGPAYEAMLVLTEELGVLVPTPVAEDLARPGGVRLEALGALHWIGFPREDSPAWYDQVVAILRSHGISVGEATGDDESLIPEVKLAAVESGRAFALAPPGWPHRLPDGVRWHALISAPVVRRTWATWPAASRRRDIGVFVAALEPQAR